MHISQLTESRFLKRADCGRGILVTIKELFQENVAKENDPPELKWCIQFYEQAKPLVLNPTVAQIIAQITKCEDTDGWVGHKIVLFDDPTVSFGGKLVGGIRARAPRNLAPAAPAPAAAPTHGMLGKPVNRTPPAPAPAPAAPPASPVMEPAAVEAGEAGEGDDEPF